MQGSVVPTLTRRAELESRLATAPLAIVTAPAGFGKTTTVRNAVMRPSHGATRVVWAELGSAFRTDAATVLAGLTRALRELGADTDALVDASDEPVESFDDATISALRAALAPLDGHVTIVLDDVHRVETPLSTQLAGLLVPWCDHDRQVIVSTRMARSELAASWPVHEASVVAGPDELRFEVDEIAALVGPALESHVESVEHATGGWPRAVDVMRRNLQIDPGSGLDRAVTELGSLIQADLLPLHDPDDLDVLTSVSLCERFTPGVADRASRRGGSALRLQRLAQEVGLVRFDGSMFSLVPVYRQALMQRLVVTDPDAMRSTYVRIADAWLDEPDSLHATVQAIEHLIDAGEFERALALLQRRWGQMYTASRPDLLVSLFDRLPTRYWADEAGSALLAGWANLLIGRGSRALELLQSHPLRTPVGEAIKRLVWAQGVWWTTAPDEAMELIAKGRRQLDALDDATTFPELPGNDDAPAFHLVADGAETRAAFLIGDLAGSIELLDDLIARPSQLEPISVAGLHAVAALVRAFRGDRHEAIEHVRVGGVIARELGVEDHYLMVPAELATAVLATWNADDVVVQRSLALAVDRASAMGAANLLRVCELVADLAGHRFSKPDETMVERAARLPFVDAQLAVRAARRLVDLGDHDGAASTIRGVRPSEFALSSWVHVLLARHSPAEVRDWLSTQPAPTCAHAQVVRFLAEATVSDDPAISTSRVRRAVAIASDRRLVAVVADAPTALWDRDEIRRLDLPMLNDARRQLREGVRRADGLRFTGREIELLRLMAQSASAAEIADRLFVSVNTVKWHKANIYRKLGVRGGRLAIERARELGLIAGDDLTA